MDQDFNKYYVYALLDPRHPGVFKYGNYVFNYEPFYIGKGTDERLNVHFQPRLLNEKNFKNSKIKKIQALGLDIIKQKISDNISENDAHKLEVILIKKIGRYDLNEGPLANLTDGGEGTSNNPKYTKRKKVEKICTITFKVLCVYDSVIKAAKLNNLDKANIASCCRNESITHGGFRWRYMDSILPITYKKNLKKQTNLLGNNGDIVKTYPSAHAAFLDTNINAAEIIACCRGNKKRAGGFNWEYNDPILKEQFKEAKSKYDDKPYRRKVLQILTNNTEIIHESVRKAASYNKISYSIVSSLCSGNYKYSNKKNFNFSYLD